MKLRLIYATLSLSFIPGPIFPASQTFISQGPGPSIDAFYGPGNTDVGTIVPIAVSPSDSNTLFIGACNGGIWRTTNFGSTWTPLTDNKNSLSISSIAFDPTDLTSKTLIAGTGVTSNGAVGGFADFFRGGPTIGIYYSTDGGDTWNGVAGNTSLVQSIPAVIARGSTLLAAAFEPTDPTVFGSNFGLFRSTNGGTTFTKLTFPGEAATSPVTSLIGDFNPATNPSNLWAAVTDPTTKNQTAVFASTDTGATWTAIFTAAQSNGLIQSTSQTVLKVVRGPSNTLAVLVADLASDEVTGVFWSGDNGVNWTQVFDLATATINFTPQGQAVVNSTLAIDPTNPNIIYVAGTYDNDPTNGYPLAAYSFDSTLPINMATSFIAGAGGTYCHPDVRSFAFDGAGNLLVSDDSGISLKTIPPSSGAWKTINGNLSLMQNYSNVYDANNNIIISAGQDTGICIQNSPQNPLFTTLRSTGDGVNAAVNDKTSGTSSYYYSSVQSLANLNRITNSGGTVGSPVFLHFSPGQDPGTDSNFSSLLVLNRIDPTLIAIGGSTISPTPQYAVSTFTDDLSSTTFSLTPRASALSSNSYIGTMAYGTQDKTNALLVGLSFLIPVPPTGKPLWLTQDASTTNLAAVNNYPGAALVSVMFDTRTVNRFFAIDGLEKLWATTNTGTSFTDITTNLPANLTGTNSHILSLEFLSNNGVNALFVGGLSNNGTLSSIAVADSDNAGNLSNYRLFGLGVPNTMVNQLTYNDKSDTLLASAYGRGAWLMYDVTSNFSTATQLQFGLAKNDSTPDTAILSNGISPSRALIKYGPGTLTISGPATYTGLTTINDGVLALSGSGAINTSSGLAITQGTFDISQTTSGATVKDLSGTSLGSIVLGSKDLLFGTNTLSVSFAGSINGSGTVTKQGTGTAIFSGTNGYTGGTTISAGILEVTGSITGNVTVNNSATFDVENSFTIGDLTSASTTSSTILGTGKTLTFGTSNSTTFAGDISGSGSLIKQGSGTTIFSGTNGYTGGTTISAGILEVTGSITGNVAVNNGATFDVENSFTIDDLTGFSGSSAILGAGKTLTFGTSNSTTFAGLISGSGALIKQGTGTAIFSGTNGYTGGTTISAGILEVTGSITGNVTVNNGATFDAENSFTIGDLTGPSGSSAILGAGKTLTFGTSNSTTFAGLISGSGAVTKQGTGTTIFSGANGYTGGTTIDAGILEVTGSITGNVTVNNSATFDVENSFAIDDLTGASGSSAILGAGKTLTFGTSNSTTFAGGIGGSGHLIKQNNGTFTTSGTSTFSDTFDVIAGTLNVPATGSFAAASTTHIGNGALLTGTGTLGTVILDGTVSPGNSIGTINTGAFSFNTGSSYLVELSNTASDVIAATGVVTISPGATLNLGAVGLTSPLSSYTIITSTMPLVGSGNFTLVNPFPRFSFAVQYDPTDVMLILQSMVNFFAKGNAGAVAKCFNTLLNNPEPDLIPVINILNVQQMSQWQDSFNQMQPANFNNIAFAQENVAERIRQNFSAHLFEQRVESCPDQKPWRVWLAPFYEHAHQRGEGENNGYKENFRGFTTAIDYQFKKHWAVTGGFSFADSDVGIVHGRASGEFKTYAGS
ncbi:MAG: autotransporter-associated beta strand repeat-containing protein, partial [Verrucomicrobia bacterium]|nr:autotransporter-associated beta strand repeat-containing protein [Verrucomicrobiota bacterium]